MNTATPYEAATALELEARRQNISYGRLVANTDPWRQDEIIDAYMEKKSGRPRRRGRPPGQTCAGCALWRPDPQSRAGGVCPAPLKDSALPKYKSRKDRACTQFAAKE